MEMKINNFFILTVSRLGTVDFTNQFIYQAVTVLFIKDNR